MAQMSPTGGPAKPATVIGANPWSAPLTRRDGIIALALVVSIAAAAFVWGCVYGQRVERGRVRQELIRYQRRHEKQRQQRVKPGMSRLAVTEPVQIVPVVDGSR